jgi:hypothetical protein
MKLTINLLKPDTVSKLDKVEVKVSDEFGLPHDPKVYAKESCNSCYGRGVKINATPLGAIPKEKLEQLHKEDPTAQYRFAVDAKGKHLTASVACHCVTKRYNQVRATYEEIIYDPKVNVIWLVNAHGVAQGEHKGVLFVVPEVPEKRPRPVRV